MKVSGIITLTTDFGLGDPYVGVMKGVILSINPQAGIIDITHEIPPGAILQAAAVVEDAHRYFPDGTVHVAVIDPGVGGARLPLAIEADGSWFVGPDNGVFGPTLEKKMSISVIQLEKKEYFLSYISKTFHGRDIFAPVAAHITAGHTIAEMGQKIKNPVMLSMPQPRIRNDCLYGEVIRVDTFGNLITSIHKADMEHFLQEDYPCIRVGSLVVCDVRQIYASVSKGEPVALYGSSGFLEIAINAGSARDYLGLRVRDVLGAEVVVWRSGNRT